jgi:hypothetical protein
MKTNLARRMPAPWTVRLSNVRLASASSPRPALSAPRPGIAARWKPRDRVSVAGN